MREANQKSLLKALDPFSKGRYLESKVKVLDMPIATGMSLFLGSFSKLFKFSSEETLMFRKKICHQMLGKTCVY